MQAQRKIFSRIVDCFRETGLNEDRFIELALQVVVWEKLSHEGLIPDELRMQPTHVDAPHHAAYRMSELGELEGDIGTAFSSANINETIQYDIFKALRDAIEIILQLRKAGVLEQPWSQDVFEGVSSRTGMFALPPDLADLIVEIAAPSENQSVYTPWDASAQLAARAAQKGCEVIIETPIRSTIPALVGLLNKCKFTVAFGDPIAAPAAFEGGRLRKFDTVLAFPPFGLRYDPTVIDSDLWGRFTHRSQSGAGLAIGHAISQTKGRCIIAVPNSFLFAAGTDSARREQIVSEGQLTAVIAMPPILQNAALSFSLLVLDAAGGGEDVRFINGDDDRFRTMTSRTRAKLIDATALARQTNAALDSDVVRIIPKDDIRSNDWNLEVSRYLLDRTAQRLQEAMRNADTVVLSDVADIIRPLQILRDGDGFTVYEVGVADLPPHGYIESASREVAVDPATAKRNAHQFLKPFDVVLVIKGSVGKVGIVPENVPPAGEGGWIAGQSAIVLRNRRNDPAEAHALAVQLRSPVGRELLKKITSGASIPIVQVRELQQMRLFAFDEVTSMHAKNAIAAEADIEKQILALVAQQEKIAAGLWDHF